MFVFHEGLPGSGKSYEAIKEHYIAALEKGTHIYTNINGVQEGCVIAAALIDKPFMEVLPLIHFLTDDDVRNLHTLQDKHDILVIVDEIQDYWPSDMRNVPLELKSYVAKHEHYHHTIIGMGQNLSDVNKVWRNRCARKITFMKLEMVGMPNKYKWTAYQGVLNGITSEVEFTKLDSDTEEYESKYFGIYKSTEGEKDKARTHYADDRTNVLKDKKILIGLPLFFLAVCYAVYHLVGFFTEPSFTSPPKAQTLKSSSSNTAEQAYMERQKKNQVQAEVQEKLPIDYLDGIAQKHRLRLSAATYTVDGDILHGYIEAYDSTDHLKERFWLKEIRALGWKIEQKLYGLDIVKLKVTHVVRPFPLHDLYGRVNHNTAESL